MRNGRFLLIHISVSVEEKPGIYNYFGHLTPTGCGVGTHLVLDSLPIPSTQVRSAFTALWVSLGEAVRE